MGVRHWINKICNNEKTSLRAIVLNPFSLGKQLSEWSNHVSFCLSVFYPLGIDVMKM